MAAWNSPDRNSPRTASALEGSLPKTRGTVRSQGPKPAPTKASPQAPANNRGCPAPPPHSSPLPSDGHDRVHVCPLPLPGGLHEEPRPALCVDSCLTRPERQTPQLRKSHPLRLPGRRARPNKGGKATPSHSLGLFKSSEPHKGAPPALESSPSQSPAQSDQGARTV